MPAGDHHHPALHLSGQCSGMRSVQPHLSGQCSCMRSMWSVPRRVRLPSMAAVMLAALSEGGPPRIHVICPEGPATLEAMITLSLPGMHATRRWWALGRGWCWRGGAACWHGVQSTAAGGRAPLALAQPPAQVLLGPAAGLGPLGDGVHLGGVEEVDAGRHALLQQLAGSCKVGGLAKQHGACGARRRRQMGAAEHPAELATCCPHPWQCAAKAHGTPHARASAHQSTAGAPAGRWRPAARRRAWRRASADLAREAGCGLLSAQATNSPLSCCCSVLRAPTGRPGTCWLQKSAVRPRRYYLLLSARSARYMYAAIKPSRRRTNLGRS